MSLQDVAQSISPSVIPISSIRHFAYSYGIEHYQTNAIKFLRHITMIAAQTVLYQSEKFINQTKKITKRKIDRITNMFCLRGNVLAILPTVI
jgi:hypothetical protein